MPKYIVVDDLAIWGYGDSEAEAWAMVQSGAVLSINRDDFICREATPELVKFVADFGGSISWGMLPNGTYCTNDQEAEAHERLTK